MLEITFYPLPDREPCSVEVSPNFLRWLAESDFMEIGAEHPIEIEIDGERSILNLVNLGQGNSSNRKRFRDFFLEAISQESDLVLSQLTVDRSKDEDRAITYKLRKLQQLRKCIENEHYQYLQRV
ncbi:MAG: hypothetical protein WBB29_23195 [Geitlerinemataceae cyanobacterium]